MSQLIVVTGPDGAGKSTVCSLLLDKLAKKSQVVDIWRGLHESPFYPCKSSIHDYLKSIDPASRGLLILHSLCRSYYQALEAKPSYIIADGYWYKYAVTERALTNNISGFQIAKTVLPKPSMTFFLDVSPQAALLRKTKVSSYEAGFSNETNTGQSFIRFQSKIHEGWRILLKENPHWHVINTELHASKYIAQIIADTILQEAVHVA